MPDQKQLEEMRKKVAARVEEENKELPDPEEKESSGSKKTYDVDAAFVRKCFIADELGDSLLFNRLHREKFVCNEISGEWLHFVGPHWEHDPQKGRVKAEIESVVDLYIEHVLSPVLEDLDKLDPTNKDDKAEFSQLSKRKKTIETRINDLRKNYKKNAVINSCIANRDSLVITHDDLDQKPWLLPVENGVYDLEFDKFYEGGRYDDYLTTYAPTPLSKDKPDCPRWKKFLYLILGEDQEQVNYMQRLLGYSITALRREHIFVVLYGPHGRNGKGTLINVLINILGSLMSKLNTEMLMVQKGPSNATGPKVEIMDMKNKRIIYASETEKGQRFAYGQIKQWSGGEIMKGRGMADNYMTEFWPSHVLFLLCNERPSAPPQDNAFWSRLRVVKFPYSFEWNCTESYHRPVDKDLEKKLLQESEGILHWLIEGTQLYKQHGENPPKKVIEDSESYREHVDDLQGWIDVHCTVNKDDASTENRELSTTLYSNYRTYWESLNSTRPMNQKEFSEQLVAKGFRKIKSGNIYYQFIKTKPQYEGPNND